MVSLALESEQKNFIGLFGNLIISEQNAQKNNIFIQFQE